MSRDATMSNLLAAARRTNAKEVLAQDEKGHTTVYTRLMSIDTLVLSALNAKLPSPQISLGSSTYSCDKGYNKDYKGSFTVGNDIYKFQDEADTWEDKTILTALHTFSNQPLKGSSSLLISRDVETFFERYPVHLHISDIEDVCKIQATNNPGLPYKELLCSMLQQRCSRIQRESQLEFYLDSQIPQVIEPFLELTFQKRNAAAGIQELTMQSTIEHYRTLIQKINNVSISPAKTSGPQQSQCVDFGTQRTLKGMNIWAFCDMAFSLALTLGDSRVLPLFVFGIVEIKQRLFTDGVLEVLKSIEDKLSSKTDSGSSSSSSSSSGKVMNQEEDKEKPSVKYMSSKPESRIDFDSSSSFGKVLNKLVQQLVRCQCTKGLLIDGSHILFLELTNEVDFEGVLGLTLFGPFHLFDQEGIRLMILAFFSFDSDFEKILEDKHQMLDVADEVKFYSASENSIKSWSEAKAKVTASTEDESMIDKNSASTQGTEISVPEVPSGMDSLNLPNVSSNTYELRKTGPPVQHSTPEAPQYDPSLISCYDVNFIKYPKFLIHSRNLAFVFRIDPRFLKAFPSSILNIDESHLKELIKESDVDKWPILKLYPPNCWDADAISRLPSIEEAYGDDDEDEDKNDGYGREDLSHSFIDLLSIGCDQVIKEAQIMKKLSSLAGVPKVIVSGVMRDVSKEKSPDKFSILSTSFHGGFILMNNVGNTLTDDGLKQLDVETKKTILATMKQIHHLDVVQGDVRADNIAVTSEANTEAAGTGRQCAYILDFGNAVITKDENLKTGEKWVLEDLLGYK